MDPTSFVENLQIIEIQFVMQLFIFLKQMEVSINDLGELRRVVRWINIKTNKS